MTKLTLLAGLLTAFSFGCASDVASTQQRVECFDTAAGVRCVPDDGSDAPVDLDGDGVEDSYICSDFQNDDDGDHDGIGDDEDDDDDNDGINDDEDDDNDDDGISDDEDDDDDNDGISDDDDCDDHGVDVDDDEVEDESDDETDA